MDDINLRHFRQRAANTTIIYTGTLPPRSVGNTGTLFEAFKSDASDEALRFQRHTPNYIPRGRILMQRYAK